MGVSRRFNVRVITVGGGRGDDAPAYTEIWEYLDCHVSCGGSALVEGEPPDSQESAVREQLDLLSLLDKEEKRKSAKEHYDALARRLKHYREQRWNVARIVDNNFVPKRTSFLTLTFSSHGGREQDIAWCNKEFSKFLRRLNRRLFCSDKMELKYVACRETQMKRAARTGLLAQHYHVVLFDVGFIPAADLEAVWGNGFVKINKCADDLDSVQHIGMYISKYFSKEILNETDAYIYEREKGKKRFFRSQNLVEPHVQRLFVSEPLDLSNVEIMYTNEYRMVVPDYSAPTVDLNKPREDQVKQLLSGASFFKEGRVRYTKIRNV